MTEIYVEESLGEPIPALGSGTGGSEYSEETVLGAEEIYPWPATCPTVPIQDTTPPEVSFVSPVPGTTIGLEEPLVVNVTDNLDELERALLVLYIHSTGVQELAFDGSAFTARYIAESTVVAIQDGFQFSLRRTGGWPNNTEVTVRVFAVDSEGNVES